MPNWCHNHMTIHVPTDQRDALLAALEGPSDWATPSHGSDMFERACPATAHQELTIEAILNGVDADRIAERDALIAAFHAHQTYPRPEWMPLTRHELRAFWLSRHEDSPQDGRTSNSGPSTAPFSVAALAPWTTRAEFDRFFPSVVDAQGFWKTDPAYQEQYNRGSKGYIALRDDRIGVKWPPTDVEVHDHEEDEQGNTLVLFTFRTPWGPPQHLGRLMTALLAAHNAQALLVWKEDNRNSGYIHINPQAGVDDEDVFERAAFDRTVAFENAEDEDDGWTVWDDEALLDAVEQGAEISFTPRLG